MDQWFTNQGLDGLGSSNKACCVIKYTGVFLEWFQEMGLQHEYLVLRTWQHVLCIFDVMLM
jgi:hypothetical protein